ncbi:cytokine receptor isoform X2 [Musca domestica]|uniref:Cytokine receptor isoform X2 n=1 Tax=Musca domestica TaxID=7370 RepID=A0A1I8NGS9_MUSDO|nr:cytokine receptor isoform X2 [Musca domestica]
MNARSSSWLQILFIVLYIILPCIHCAMHNSPGETQPPRVEIKINSNTNITCRMNLMKFGNKVNSSSLYFVEEDTGKRVPETDIEIINETTITYMLRNATEQDRNYVCKSDGMGIGVTHVSVGTAPLDVTDFKCRGYDYTYMMCNFTIPHNVILTKYSLNYTAQSANYMYTCPLEIQERQAICNLTLDQNKYRTTHEFFNFTLRGENGVGTNVQSFWINNYESVIPPRPEYTFEDITCHSAVIKWHNNKYSYYKAKGLQYDIRLRPKDSDIDWMSHSNYEIRQKQSEYKIILRDIPFAYVWYELSVRVRVKKSARFDDSYWSEPYIQQFRTAPCPPDAAPLTDSGSFYIVPTQTQVRLYWHQLPEYKMNGPNFTYVIEQVKIDGVEVSMEPLEMDLISAKFPWHRQHRYEFRIKSRNSEGDSPDSNIINIPVWSKHNASLTSPEWIKNVYDSTNRTYTLTWGAPKKLQGLVDYTVFWCQSKKATQDECKGTINFAHVSRNSTQFIVTPQKEDQSLNLAVSANYRDFNTGMHWMCAADRTADLGKMEPEVMSVSSRSITIQLRSDHICTSLLEGYNITYCRVHRQHNNAGEKAACADKPITRTILGTAKKFVIENLKPFSVYKIELLVFSKLKTGKMSDPLIVHTKEEAPSKPLQLRAHNVTSSSAVLTWLSPEHHNGILTKYRIEYNNENYIIDCKAEEVCTKKEMTFTLENLSSFTNYKVYIVAYTNAAPSEHSNDINVKTLVGIPSNPSHITESQNILQWSKPEVPSGRVEFYQVAIMVWYKNEIQRQYISNVANTTCKFNLPVCRDSDQRFTIQVRAVNVALRETEIDQYIFAAKNPMDSEDDLVHDNAYFNDNDDLKCEDSGMTEEKERMIRKYSDQEKYVLYKSVWEKAPVTNCSDSKMSRITMLALLVVVSSLGVIAAFYVAHNKYQKMVNITCALPPGLEAYPTKNDGTDFRRNKDFFNTESRHLLSSISNDFSNMCQNGDHVNVDEGGIDGLTTGSLDKSSGYIGSNNSTQYYDVDAVRVAGRDSDIVDPVSTVDDAYMVMERLKPTDCNLTSSNSTLDKMLLQTESNSGYVQSNLLTLNGKPNPALPPSFIPTENGYIKQVSTLNSLPTDHGANAQVIPSQNGYVKLHDICNLSTPKFAMTAADVATPQMSVMHTVPTTTMCNIPVNSTGYVAPHLLQKNLIQPPATNGYTTPEALGKTMGLNHLSQAMIGGGGNDGGGRLANMIPPISGYVTRDELRTAFSQQSQFN